MRCIGDILVVEGREAERRVFEAFLVQVRAAYMGGNLQGYFDPRLLRTPAVTIHAIDPLSCTARDFPIEMSPRTLTRAREHAGLPPGARVRKRDVFRHLVRGFERYGLVTVFSAWARDYESWRKEHLDWLSMRKARSIEDALLLARTIVNEKPAAYFAVAGGASWRRMTPFERILDQVEDLETYVRVAEAIGARATRKGAAAMSLALAIRDAERRGL
jgi:hypothetical protein